MTYNCMILVAIALVGILPSELNAQLHSSSVPFSGTTRIYFQEGDLASNGFDITDVKDAVVNAMAVWNEGSQADIDMVWGGDTTSETNIPDGIMVAFNNYWDCDPVGGGGGSLARAFGSGGLGPVIRVILRDCPTSAQVAAGQPGNLRDWKTEHSPGGFMFEATLVHEFGHALFGFPNASGATVMTAYAHPHNNFRHLFPIDVNTARQQGGFTWRRGAYLESVNAVSWGGTSYMSMYSTHGAVVAGRSVTPVGYSSRVFGTPHVDSSEARLKSGLAYFAPSGTVRAAIDVAATGYGETLVVWLEDSLQGTHSPIGWAWTNNDGVGWITGSISRSGEGTITRPLVAYDESRDRFALFFIDGDSGQIVSTSTPAYSPSWAVPSWAQTTRSFRFLGGMATDGSAGVVTAALDDASQHRLVQMTLSVSGTTYTLGPATLLCGGVTCVTRRPFGTDYSASAGLLLVGWRGPGANRSLTVASRNGLAPGYLGSATSVLSNVVNSVDINFSPDLGLWTAGVSNTAVILLFCLFSVSSCADTDVSQGSSPLLPEREARPPATRRDPVAAFSFYAGGTCAHTHPEFERRRIDAITIQVRNATVAVDGHRVLWGRVPVGRQSYELAELTYSLGRESRRREEHFWVEVTSTYTDPDGNEYTGHLDPMSPAAVLRSTANAVITARPMGVNLPPLGGHPS